MQKLIDFKTAQDRHPNLVPLVISEINSKLQKAKLPTCSGDQMEWSYVWVQRLGGEPLDNCFVSLQAKAGRRFANAPLASEGEPTPRDLLPQEVAKAYEKGPEVTEDYPHITKFNLTSPNGTIKTALALSGYESKRGTFLHVVEVGDEMTLGERAFESLYKITGNLLLWNGSLHQKARHEFDATLPGGEFRYRNMKFRRLTEDEIRTLIEGKDMVFSMGI